jgi:hypothetical protein
MEDVEVEESRRRVIEALTRRRREAETRDADPCWASGNHRPMRWVARALALAIDIVRSTDPEPGEGARAYLTRIASRVSDHRDDGPDLDDEAWYAGAIDEASMLISSAGE